MSLLAEIQRRKVIRVAAVYAVVAWLLVQIVSTVENPLNLPSWFDTAVIVLLAIGFPVALVLAWAFDLTPQGIRHTDSEFVPSSQERTTIGVVHPLSHTLQFLILGAVSFLLIDQFVLSRSNAESGVSSSRAVAREQRVSISLPLEHTVAVGWTPGLSVAISPDGNTIAYASSAWDDQSITHHIVLRDLRSLDVRPVPNSDGAAQPFFSPDSEWVAFPTATGSLMKASVAGGEPVELATGISGGLWATGTWTPDGDIIFVSGGNFLNRVSDDGGTVETLVDLSSDPRSLAYPEYLPGSNAILFTTSEGFRENAQALEAFLLDTGERRLVLDRHRFAKYSPTGHLIYQRGEASLLIAPFDDEAIALTGDPVPLPESIRLDGLYSNGFTKQFDVSDAGDIIYIPQETSEIGRRLYVVDRGGAAVELGFRADQYDHLAVSPDGTRLAVDNSRVIRILDLDRGSVVSETLSGRALIPTWRPDGKAILMTRVTPETTGLYEQEIGLDERPILVSENDIRQLVRNAAYHPRENVLLFTRGGGDDADIWRLRLDDSVSGPESFIAGQPSEHSPKFSPDGQWLAFVSNQSGEHQIYVRRYPDGEDIAVSSGLAFGPVWARDSSELYFHGLYDGEMQLLAVPVGSSTDDSPVGRVEALFPLRVAMPTGGVEVYALNTDSGPRFDVLPDGRFVLSRGPDQTRLRELVLVQGMNWPDPTAGSE